MNNESQLKVVITAREEVLACDCEFSAVHNTLSHAAKVRAFDDNVSACVAFWCIGVLLLETCNRLHHVVGIVAIFAFRWPLCLRFACY